MKNKKVLINFQMPASTKERFDRFCEITGKSKTSVLISLVEDHLVYQISEIEQKVNNIRALDNQIVRHAKVMRFKDFIKETDECALDDRTPFNFFTSNGQDEPF